MSNSSSKKARAIYLDGRTLEGGGQLVRIAIALSTITGHPITIDHIRGNRSGKQGLKGSHLAAIEYLADVSKSQVAGAKIGSMSLTFRPPRKPLALTKTDIDIRLTTAGSIFLVFQALYPYLLYTGGISSDENPQPQPIRMSVTGGTNVSFAPSYDYVSQVLVPNFAKIGLPPLAVQLDKRGWSSGPFDLGKASFVIEPIRERSSETCYGFPSVDLNRHKRGRVTQIDITVLAPDSPVSVASGSRQDRRAHLNQANREPSYPQPDEVDEPTTRQFIQDEIVRLLRARLGKLAASIFKRKSPDALEPLPGLIHSDDHPTSDPVPITIHTSETTHHHSHIYLLIVAHTSRGFKLGRDTLFGAQTRVSRRKTDQPRVNARSHAVELAERCVDGFVRQLYDPRLQGAQEGRLPCVDEYMRDQLVIFEALGRSLSSGSEVDRHERTSHTLHTKTARWVCEQMLDGEGGIL
ncbi:putative RNA 3'-terminal phosphate cyclase [Aspergillus clavatus NRRL 1]|uniref:RNA 3'-terminal phosphate cyclase, putative n=1 Tax=Aspergillus clavatus (strain ATCC 1007 / CBS 513.65 / DSM 816 / NCTC 3887 / NRRL 1 / QM 1276 / 107) TaxID=344612 RepID=A1CA90_ASPCL|nr:RNA 3'-terminal phosphate cyclase, putative [Aspergillus clavatus NRRL 1]EAW12658.1 RNA 3'-terminal phosphate cyclase, putative [Aspergillus clavatus NRRL 1]